MIYVFLNDYFSNEQKLTVVKATIALTFFGIAGFFGQLVGGFFGQSMYNYNKKNQVHLMWISTLLSIPPMLFLLNCKQAGSTLFYLMSFLCGFLVSITGPNVRSILQNVTTPRCPANYHYNLIIITILSSKFYHHYNFIISTILSSL